jgi:hypothetical protein
MFAARTWAAYPKTHTKALINTIVQSIWLRAFGLIALELSGFHLIESNTR